MKIAICDDDKSELLRISSILNNYIKERNVSIYYKTFQSGTELLAKAKSEKYDAYILDIIMPAINGIDIAKEIRSFDKIANVIFLTSSPEFAIESYSVKACNYVLKPVTKKSLFFVLDDLFANLIPKNKEYIIVKGADGIQKILISNLEYVEAFERKAIYYLASGGTIECNSQFSDVCDQLLCYDEFIRPHRSYIINMAYISNIKNNQIILQPNLFTVNKKRKNSLPLAQRRISDIKESFLNFLLDSEQL